MSTAYEPKLSNIIGQFVPELGIKGGEGGLAKSMAPNSAQEGCVNVVNDYPWTLTPKKGRDEVPYVRLTEFKCNESQINRQIRFYTAMGADIGAEATPFNDGVDKTGTLEKYREIFSHDDPTDFSYWFPYFSDSNFELSTPNWDKIDAAGEQIKNFAGGITGFLFGKEAEASLKKGLDLFQAGGELAALKTYPTVGVLDRPRIFTKHEERQITISFPLYNTFAEGDWQKNYSLLYQLMSQNLFNKRDYITGVPPVFYDVYIPGQYYCWASAMTNINVKNLGNVRMLGKNIVPDAYQVSLTLSEMIMPSKNQFEAVISGEAESFVNSETVLARVAEEEAKKGIIREIVDPITGMVVEPRPVATNSRFYKK